jgi:hypothetical protein
MKKYLTGIVAVLIAVSAVALPKLNSKAVDYYWYKRTGTNTYVSNGHGTDPLVSCSGSLNICAKGFLTQQNASNITDATLGDTPDRVKN